MHMFVFQALLLGLLWLPWAGPASAAAPAEAPKSIPSKDAGTEQTDIVKTSQGDLAIIFLGHGTLMFTFGGMTIHVDPYSKVADYSTLPKADLVLLTHEHQDHTDPSALDKIRTEETVIVASPAASAKIPGARAIRNGESVSAVGVAIEAVPAYNLVHKRDSGQPFHPKGEGNGYVVTFGDKHVYIAGDTENIPEMQNLGPIDIAFLPVNLPFTMTPEMLADAAAKVRPKILYPYHTGTTDMAQVSELLKSVPGVEVRLRNMQ